MDNNLQKLFNTWAESYDKTVIESDNQKTYPFAGYKKIQEFIFNTVIENKSYTILEMGIGTGSQTHFMSMD